MQNEQNWLLIFKHLNRNESPEDTIAFHNWLQQGNNRDIFERIEHIWQAEKQHEESFAHNMRSTFRKKYTPAKMKAYIVNQALGNLIGFIIGIWVVSTFTHEILERKSLKNIFGLLERKKVVVNDIPIWMQNTVAIIVGYIVLEFIAFFFQSRLHILIGKQLRNYLKRIGN